MSPFLYKTYINPCLMELKEHKIGLLIGTTYCGCPTCADDLALLSECENELQIMSNVVKRHSRQDRVTIHPDKSNAVLLNKPKSYSKKSFSLDLSEKTISLSSDTTHLGLLRSESNENNINIEERLKLARRILYALVNTGVHGSNGLNPRVSFKIYQYYVIPRLLFGLEVLPINQTQLNLLSKFHVNTLKRFQALRQLSLLYNILVSSNETITELSERQIAVNLDNPLSYFSRVQSVLGRWRLCLFRYVCTPSKLAAVLSPSTRVLLPHLSTGSDRYTDTTTIRDQRTVRKLTLNPLVFWEFFDRMVVSGCHVSRP